MCPKCDTPLIKDLNSEAKCDFCGYNFKLGELMGLSIFNKTKSRNLFRKTK